MLELKLHTLLVVAHLIGLALGAGGAFVTDIFVTRYAIFGRIDARTPDVVAFLGNIVAVGLVILWLTGLALMAEAMILKPLFYTNQKFWAKFAIVILLTINGISIHNRIMPILKAQVGRKLFDGLPVSTKIALCATGALSFVSWMFPILLGSAKELSYVASFAELMALYLVAFLALTALAAGFAIKILPQVADARRIVQLPRTAASRTATVIALRSRRPSSSEIDDTAAFLADTLRQARKLAADWASPTAVNQTTSYVSRRHPRIQSEARSGTPTPRTRSLASHRRLATA
ncbi:MAG: hypothetical protein SH859_04110 [Hyphomicrobium aestuarii]|nr:hypothetical protein [Hyphomicrobium aestuarii]